MTSHLRAHLPWVALAAFASACLTGCNSDSTLPRGGADEGGFISDNPSDSGGKSDDDGSTGGSGDDGNGGEPAPSPADPSDPERAITEADIIQVKDGKLYALSQYAGLSVIDVSVKDKLKLLGRHEVSGVPFEMYLRDGVVYAMYASWGHSIFDETKGSYEWVQTSHIEALDVTNPASIQTIGSFDLPGSISDSRIVGDVLYAVTFESGYCWGCDIAPNTTITSLSVGDPEAIAVVDQLRYTDNDPYGYGWRRSVSVTDERMYVAGIEWDGQSEGHSTIQVIDISDPTGQLVEGASIEATGQIESRWQMDEHEGVLRVISQPGIWWSSAMPGVQTFSVASSQSIQPLGYTELTLPKPETLRSVRFDGARAYAITAEQTDPLFTIDLSDPAQPKQLGELEMPGWVYHMEPRGDRLIALGFDNASPEGALHVSLFDVSDLTQPKMLKRVGFGGQWSSLGEDQDRIHKSFRVLDELGLILVPYSGFEYDKDASPCGTYKSGIQLIDLTHDTLEKRGAAPSRGQARRAFIHDERLFAVSDEQVGTFNIDDRDVPTKITDLALATWVNQSVKAGDYVVRVGADWWTSDARLEVVPASAAGQAEPLGALDLSALSTSSAADACFNWGFYGARLFTHQDHVYAVWPSGNGAETRVAVISVADPTEPQLTGQLDLPFPLFMYGYSSGTDGQVVAPGDPVVQTGSTLVFRRVQAYNSYEGKYDPTALHKAWIEVVDLSNPSKPAHAATLALPDAMGHTPLRIEGSTVLTSHWVPLADDSTKVRFYLDRINVANPLSPQALTPVNVPGTLVSFDPSTSRLLTVDYKRLSFPVSALSDCYEAYGYSASFEPKDPEDYLGQGTCAVLKRSFKLVKVQGSTASLLATRPIDDGTYIWNVFVGDDRVFLKGMNESWNEEDGQPWSSMRITVVGVMQGGEIDMVFAEDDALADANPVLADGKRLITSGWSPPSLGVLDATDMNDVTFEQKAELSGYVNSVTVDGDLALCSLGPHGLEVVDLGQ